MVGRSSGHADGASSSVPPSDERHGEKRDRDDKGEASEKASGLEFECCICFELLLDPVVGNCGHDFCKSCYEEWIRRSKNGDCPKCRKELPRNLGVCIRLKNTIEALYPVRIKERRRVHEAQAKKNEEERARKVIRLDSGIPLLNPFAQPFEPSPEWHHAAYRQHPANNGDPNAHLSTEVERLNYFLDQIETAPFHHFSLPRTADLPHSPTPPPSNASPNSGIASYELSPFMASVAHVGAVDEYSQMRIPPQTFIPVMSGIRQVISVPGAVNNTWGGGAGGNRSQASVPDLVNLSQMQLRPTSTAFVISASNRGVGVTHQTQQITRGVWSQPHVDNFVFTMGWHGGEASHAVPGVASSQTRSRRRAGRQTGSHRFQLRW